MMSYSKRITYTLSMIFRPHKVVFTWGECDVIVKSKKTTHNDQCFEKTCQEIEHFLKAGLNLK